MGRLLIFRKTFGEPMLILVDDHFDDNFDPHWHCFQANESSTGSSTRFAKG
jgi:hypothetical protein